MRGEECIGAGKAGVVKGGAAIKLRVGDGASRLTTDLDDEIEAVEAEAVSVVAADLDAVR